MIALDFLAAADGTPLTKQFYFNNGEIDKTPYPHVKHVTSYRETVENLDQMYEALRSHAALNHCLLKGNLKEPLVNQSRAGQTSPDDQTRWLLLDLDFDEGYESVDDFLVDVNPAWEGISYIWQHSASAGITSPAGLRGHVFVLLEKPITPAQAKQWLMERNLLLQDTLGKHLRLTASGLALSWPLDITTCQNDKLIYIAPPTLIGMDDPIDERIVLVKRDFEFGAVPLLSQPTSKTMQDATDAINNLRRKAGLPKRNARTRTVDNIEILTNPDRAVVTGVKTARGFTYLNLNGGDSWGYYFPEKNPKIVYNFKGEPAFQLADIDPDFARQYQARLDALEEEEREELLQGRVPYVFRDARRDTYYNVLYDKPNDRIDMIAQCSSKQRLADFMSFHMTPMPDPLEDWTVEFDPTTTDVIRPDQYWINLYEPTEYVKFAHKLTPVHQIPPIIDTVLTSVTGSDPEAKERFINWIAHIFQTRRRTETAWVLQGIEGTGKGITISRILKPLLGPKHVVEWSNSAFADNFNAALEHAIILYLDEFRAASAGDPETIMARLRNYITEHRITIRGMRQNAIQVNNYLNIIIATNKVDPISIEPHDRRFNVCPAQEKKLILTPEQVDAIADELPAFASYLWNYKVDHAKVRTPMDNAAKALMTQNAHNSVQTFFDRLLHGDLAWFVSFLTEGKDQFDLIAYQRYEEVMRRWCEAALSSKDGTFNVSREDIRAAYSYIQGKTLSPAAFTRMAGIHRVPIKLVRINGTVQRGFQTYFNGKNRDAVEHAYELLTVPKTPKLERVK